jgi:hypothetical protein
MRNQGDGASDGAKSISQVALGGDTPLLHNNFSQTTSPELVRKAP